MAGSGLLKSYFVASTRLVTAVLLLGAASPASADPIPVGQVRIDALRSQFTIPGGGNYRAGEFVVNASQLSFSPSGTGKYGAAAHQYVSFCVELTELIQLNKWYKAELNTESRSGNGTTRPLQSETAYLYTQFINGTLDGYAHFDSNASASDKVASARALQELIWYFQDRTNFEARYGANAFDIGGYFLGSGAHKLLARQWYEEVNAAIDGDQWSGIGKVRIINIWENALGRQDTLTMIPLPAPVWLAGVGLGLAGLIVIRNRRRAPAGDAPIL